MSGAAVDRDVRDRGADPVAGLERGDVGRVVRLQLVDRDGRPGPDIAGPVEPGEPVRGRELVVGVAAVLTAGVGRMRARLRPRRRRGRRGRASVAAVDVPASSSASSGCVSGPWCRARRVSGCGAALESSPTIDCTPAAAPAAIAGARVAATTPCPPRPSDAAQLHVEPALDRSHVGRERDRQPTGAGIAQPQAVPRERPSDPAQLRGRGSEPAAELIRGEVVVIGRRPRCRDRLRIGRQRRRITGLERDRQVQPVACRDGGPGARGRGR